MAVRFLMTERDIIAADYCPGFVVDPTYWRVFIDARRNLRQEVVITDFSDPENNEVLRYSARISKPEFASLWEIVHRTRFKEFEGQYKPKTICVTDRSTHSLAVRLDGRLKEVAIYDLHTMVEFEKDVVAIGFLELWEATHQRAPHGKVEVAEGRPKPWWRLW